MKQLAPIVLAALTALAPAACLQNDGAVDAATTTPTETPDTSVETPDTAAPDVEVPASPSYPSFIGDWTMKPREESTRCMHKRLDNVDPIWVTSITTKLAPGSHHLIVYRSTETEEDAEPKPCTPFIDVIGGDAYPLMITQIPEETLQLPPGVALPLEAHQMIRLEAHYLNYYTHDIVAHADVTFQTVPHEQVENEAGLMLYGTPDIRVPAGQKKSTPWYYLPLLDGVKLFAATGHTHQYGTNVELRKASASDPTGLANEAVESEIDIYPGEETFAWDESPVLKYDPPLEFGPNDGIRYRCSWENTSGHTVSFGESANQEMCFFWLYYYPSNGYRLCINLGSWYDYGQGLVDYTECCPESSVCGLITAYLKNGFGQ